MTTFASCVRSQGMIFSEASLLRWHARTAFARDSAPLLDTHASEATRRVNAFLAHSMLLQNVEPG
jgi:hypothetical protein